MNFSEGFRIALWSLAANPLRSFLTLLGIIIGVTAIISVVAVINGLNSYVEEKIITLGPSSFEVNRFGIITNRKEFLDALRRNRELRMGDVKAIKEYCTLAELVAVKVYTNADIRYGRKAVRSVSVVGITPEILLVEPYEVESGRPITHEENNRGAAVTFIGYDVAQELFGSVDPIGKKIKAHGRSFEVVGVGAKRGSVFGHSRDNYGLIPLQTFQKQSGQRSSVSIVIRTEAPEDVEQAMDEVRTVLRARHHLRHWERDDFGFVSAEALNALWRSLSRTIFQVALFVVGISLVVGGIVIMNIMLVSVIERTREVGLRKAVGARQRDIERQFLIESAVLSAVGGLTGVAFAYAATLAIRKFSPLPAAFPWWAPALALGISSAVGIFFGIYPARKAARLNPIEALRSD
jgi:putative ABC transport system permease protein